jgi:hypothetical protein
MFASFQDHTSSSTSSRSPSVSSSSATPSPQKHHPLKSQRRRTSYGLSPQKIQKKVPAKLNAMPLLWRKPENLDTEKCNRRIGIAKRKLQQRNQPASQPTRRGGERGKKKQSWVVSWAFKP